MTTHFAGMPEPAPASGRRPGGLRGRLERQQPEPVAVVGLAGEMHAHALLRLDSLADNLVPSSLPGTLEPIKPMTADLDLEPGSDEPTVWRDKRWRLRWPRTVDELQAVIHIIYLLAKSIIFDTL